MFQKYFLQAHLDKLIEESNIKTSPSFDLLRDLTQSACDCDELISAAKGDVTRKLVMIGEENGLSKNTSEAAVLDGYNAYMRECAKRERERPENIALENAKQEYRNRGSLRHIGYNLAKIGVPIGSAIDALLDRYSEYSQDENAKAVHRAKQAELEAGYTSAVEYNFSDTPGAAQIAENPTTETLVSVMAAMSEPTTKFIPKDIYARWITMLIDNEAGRVMIPEAVYKSAVDIEIELIKDNPTIRQLDESVQRVALTDQGINQDIFLKLHAAYKSAHL